MNKCTKHHFCLSICIILFSWAPLLVYAQISNSFLFSLLPTNAYIHISDSLYHALPSDRKPIDRNHVTYIEADSILLKVNVQYPIAPFESEFNHIASKLDSISIDNKNKKIQVECLTAVAFYEVNKATNPAYALVPIDHLIQKIGNDTAYGGIAAQARLMKTNLLVQLGRNEDAAYIIPQVLEWAMPRNNYSVMANAYLMQALIYTTLQLYENAVEASKKSVIYFDTTKNIRKVDPNSFITNYMIRSECYLKLYRERSEIGYGDTAVRLIRAVMFQYHDHPEWFATCYRFLGMLSYAKHDYVQSIHYFDSALLPQYKTTDLQSEGVYGQLYKGMALVHMGQLSDGWHLIEEAIRSNVANNGLLYLDYFELYKVAKERKDIGNAMKYLNSYTHLKDSVNTIGQRVQLFNIQEKYENTKKEAVIKNLQNKARLKLKQQYLFLAIGVIVILLLVIVIIARYIYQKRREQKDRMIQQELKGANVVLSQQLVDYENKKLDELYDVMVKQQTKISEDMHNELGSALTALRYYIGDMRINAATEPIKQLLGNIEDEADSVYNQARNYIHALKDNAQNIKYDLSGYLNYLATHFNDKSVLKIDVQVDIPELEKRLSINQNNELYFILKEGVTNVLKHSQASALLLKIILQAGQLDLLLKDNGIGIKKTNNGIGLSNIQLRVENLGGNLEMQSDEKGTSMHFIFSIN